MPQLQLSYSADRVYCRIGIKKMPEELRTYGKYTPCGWLFPITMSTASRLLTLANQPGWHITHACRRRLTDELPRLRQVTQHDGNRFTVPYLITEPRWYQVTIAKELIGYPGALVDMKMGMGKTLTTIMALHLIPPGRVLIVTPKKALDVWLDDWAKHFEQVNAKVQVLDHATSALKAKALRAMNEMPITRHHHVSVINYESVWRPNIGDAILATNWDVVVWDEVHRLQSASSRVSWFAKSLRPRAKYMWGLSGTPMPNGPISIYGTARALSPMTFGTNKKAFEARYGIFKQVGPSADARKVIQYINMEDFAARLNQFRLYVDVPDEELGLPEINMIPQLFSLSPAEHMIYTDMLNDFRTFINGTEVTAANAAVKLMRALQITSGFLLPAADDEATNPVEVGNSKEQALEDLLIDLAPDEKVVVFYRFTHCKHAIERCSVKLGRPYYEVSGQTNQIKDWVAAPPGAIIAAQLRAASEGLNDLVAARYGIYYDQTYSYRDFYQSGKRLHRPGQHRPVFLYYLLARRTIELDVMQAVKDKRDIIDYVTELAGKDKIIRK